jgi:hypothetical protein
MAVIVLDEGGGHAEANLSTEEAETKAHARFPCTAINQEWTEDP